MKKLLSIILSVFMMVTTLTTNVIAEDYATIGEVLETVDGGFPSTYSDAWLSSNYSSVYFESEMLWFGGCTYHKSCNVTKNDNNDYVYTSDSATITFGMTENVLTSITVEGHSSSTVNGTYSEATQTVEGIVATNSEFPTSINSPWRNENGSKLYYDSAEGELHYHQYSYPDPVSGTNKVVKNGNNYITKDSNGALITFVMQDGVVDHVEVSDSYISIGNGSFYDRLTIGDIIAKTAGGFPTSNSVNTVPDNHWNNQYDQPVYAYTDGSYTYIKYNNNSVLDCENIVYLEGNNYIYQSPNNNGGATFYMDNDTLDYFVVNNIYGGEDHLYTCKKELTVKDMLPADFPIKTDGNVPANSWVNADNAKLYVVDASTGDFLNFYYDSNDSNSVLLSDKVTKVNDNEYTAVAYANNAVITFYLDDTGKLLSLKLDDSTNCPKSSGEYKIPKTIAEILPNDFPTTSGTAWVNDRGYKIYLDAQNGLVTPDVSIKTTMALEKDGSNYKYNADSYTLKFVMDNDKLKEIQISDAVYMSQYVEGTYKSQYVDGIAISVIAGEHGSVEISRVAIKKDGAYVTASFGALYDNNSNCIATATADDGYEFAYWDVNGKNVFKTNYKYDVTEETEFKAVFTKVYDITVGSITVSDYNKDDVMGDGKVKYDPTTKTLTITGYVEEDYYVSGICAGEDLTIVTTNNVKINGFATRIGGNVYGIYSAGNLVINAGGKLIVESSVGNPSSYIGKKIAGIYANNVTINSGDIDVIGATYGIHADATLTINDTYKPVVKSYSNNTVAFSAESIVLNGDPYIYGSISEYVKDNTKTLLQAGQDAVTITYDEDSTVLYDLWVGGVRVTSKNASDVLNDNYVSYDPSTKTLTFAEGAIIYGKDGYGVYCLHDLNVYINGYVNIDANSSAIYSTGVSYGIYCEGDLNVSGDNKDVLLVQAAKAQTISCGIFCDGRLTISQKVQTISSSVEFLNNDTEDFCISAGVWAKGGITINGSDKDTNYLRCTGGSVTNVEFNTYGILSGDGNPGYSEEATIDVNKGFIIGSAGISMKSSSYGIFSYGDINLNNSKIAGSASSSLEDNADIHTEADLNMSNNSAIEYESNYQSYQGHYRKLYCIEVEGTTTVENSKINIQNFQYMPAETKKSHTIHTKNLVVKDGADIDVVGFQAFDGESVAIYVKNKLDVQGGTIKAYGGTAADGSYGIYAGSQSFDGSHSISGGSIYAQGNTCGEDCESIGLRTKKGDLNISGGTLELVGKTNGLNSSGVITITNDNSTHISAKADNKNAIYSKEPISLDNATIENATELYPTETTSEFIQSGSNPVIIRFKIRADISGVAMLYPEGQSSYIYGDGVWYSGDLVATNNVTKEDITNQIDEFYYEWYQKVDDEYIYINGTPFEAGEYKLVVTYYNDNYEGEQVIPFTINKKTLTVNYSGYEYVYDGEAHKPEIVFSGLLYGDVASFDEPLTYTIYDEDGNPVTNAIDVGMYEIDTTISQTDTFTVLYDGDDVTSNYEVKTGSINYDFYIFDNIYAMNNITTAMINNSLAYDCDIEPISLDEAKIIASENQALLQAINDGDEVTFYTELASVSDSHVFDEVDIDSSNSFLFSVSLYARVKGSDVIYEINNSHAKNVKISLYLVESQVEGFVGSNKNYYVYRKHNGVLNELPCELNKANEYYVFTFGNSLFSDFAIFSKNKPVNPIIHNDTHNVPNTSDIH